MKIVARYGPVVARILLGALFVFSGSNKLFHFMNPPPPPERALAFFMALVQTGYFMPLLGIVETVAGLLLLANRFVPLALVVLAPIVVNIVAFHVVLAPAGVPTAVLVVLFELGLAWAYRDAFRSLLVARATPAGAKREA